MTTEMEPDERQEVGNYARVWARRIRLVRDVCLEEELGPELAERIAECYARAYIIPDYTRFYRDQAAAQGDAVKEALVEAFRTMAEGEEER